MAKKALLKGALKYLKKVAKNPTKIKTKKESPLSKYYRKNVRDTGIAIGAATLGGTVVGHNLAKSKEGKETIKKLKDAVRKYKNRKKGKKK
jgi:hypothetical protein